jgi:hypothetical protein
MVESAGSSSAGPSAQGRRCGGPDDGGAPCSTAAAEEERHASVARGLPLRPDRPAYGANVRLRVASLWPREVASPPDLVTLMRPKRNYFPEHFCCCLSSIFVCFEYN